MTSRTLSDQCCQEGVQLSGRRDEDRKVLNRLQVALINHAREQSSCEGAGQPGEWLADRKATDIEEVTDGIEWFGSLSSPQTSSWCLGPGQAVPPLRTMQYPLPFRKSWLRACTSGPDK